MSNYRIEKDSMGEVQVPADALYGAQTQRAVDNFPISGQPLPRPLIRALGLIKAACAEVNRDLGLLDEKLAAVIIAAAQDVADGRHDSQFPIDIFQTGSGTSSNMNANEVIATLAAQRLGGKVHPNDHVNMSQSSNDVFPTAIHVAACLEIEERLLPALEHLAVTTEGRAEELKDVVKTGRTHLMDAMPVTFGQEISGWAAQLRHGIERLHASLPRLRAIVQGGTAVGTGINAPADFGPRVASALTRLSGVAFTSMDNYFEGLSSQDAAVEMSGQLKTLAVSLMKIANDLRWMNSGPLAGIGDIRLQDLQPGSSIMPGKVNPVIPEAVMMVCAQVLGNDVAISVGGQHGNFQLNVMLPMIARNLVESVHLLTGACQVLADKAMANFTVNVEGVQAALNRNPILVTALNRVIGYEKGAAIAKRAYTENRPILDVAKEETGLSEDELRVLLNPARLTQGGVG
ncbi:class II fumarate hydratase [Sulfurivermis fontis]|uniref:class II fumarate hydratase n=1 Tax=Sulfurivermis fontis TaxID=1972068 RepID=UPI000FD7E8DE|nr:class II fumarate hydratase [Sulfurivermis fontis]